MNIAWCEERRSRGGPFAEDAVRWRAITAHPDAIDNSDEDVTAAIPLAAQESIPPALEHASRSDLHSAPEGSNPAKEFSLLLLKCKEARRLPESTLNEITNDILTFFTDWGPQLYSVHGDNVESFINSEIMQLRTQSGRERFCTSVFPYVEPVTVVLSAEGNAQASFQYVPIVEMLKRYLEWLGSSLMPGLDGSDESLSSVFDGSAFVNHEYFSGDREKLVIQLYTDEFEVCNPIGAQRLKHKMMAVYYTLLNAPPHFRTQLPHIHLAVLCKEKHIAKYGLDKVLERLHQDIAQLETEGITVNSKHITGTVLCLSGDNLSSHRIGGFKHSTDSTWTCFEVVLQRCAFMALKLQVRHTRKDFSRLSICHLM
ncbi:uncharacterized protein LOC135372665 [Ornithodoros turicata]|uniref:uncharacterized protein LOC135372665 n=1 Tax=Ornithodoros turicata TaxID=34597 RepID=UPI00313939FE